MTPLILSAADCQIDGYSVSLLYGDRARTYINDFSSGFVTILCLSPLLAAKVNANVIVTLPRKQAMRPIRQKRDRQPC